MKNNKEQWELLSNGIVKSFIVHKRSWLYRLFHGKNSLIEITGIYIPKRQYSLIEIVKLERLMRCEGKLSEEDIVLLINTIRPNTFKKHISEIKNNRYYAESTLAGGLYLYKLSK